ncbi:MAG: NAD(P)H-dependent oxidoreductase [Xanthobacteraceae bacterium]|nr:NAD(P)H-dependent oxidoreductase [Xanthobacteraceae bacterium]
MTLRISIVVGNPKPKSRTLKVAEMLAAKLFGPAAQAAEVIDLADYRDEILTWPNERMDALNARVAASDVVIFASPTYKATYTGLLKVFLDRYPANGLEGVTAIPLLTGADQLHAMGPTVNLAPLLVELGAVVPGRGFYFVTGQMDRVDEIVQAAADQYAMALRRLANVAAALPNSDQRST